VSGTVHVAVGIVADASGAILIARRPDHVHQGGRWEFPGGKVEAAETVATALQVRMSKTRSKSAMSTPTPITTVSQVRGRLTAT